MIKRQLAAILFAIFDILALRLLGEFVLEDMTLSILLSLDNLIVKMNLVRYWRIALFQNIEFFTGSYL